MLRVDDVSSAAGFPLEDKNGAHIEYIWDRVLSRTCQEWRHSIGRQRRPGVLVKKESQGLVPWGPQEEKEDLLQSYPILGVR